MAARDGGRLLFWSTGEAERVDVWDGRGGEEAGAVATTVAMGGRCGRAMVVGAERSGKVGSVAMPTGMVRRVGGGGGAWLRSQGAFEQVSCARVAAAGR